jgi:hypothetical protein
MGSSTTPTQTPAPDQKPVSADAKAACPCCDKMTAADQKDAHACMHPKATAADGKGAMSCCAGKDATAAASCCGAKDGKSCSKGNKESAACCGKSSEVMKWCAAQERKTLVPRTAAAVATNAGSPLTTITPRAATELLNTEKPRLDGWGFLFGSNLIRRGH